MSVNDYHDEVRVDENGYFYFDIPFCPGEVVLRIRADGYLSTLKILDVPTDTLGILDNIQVVLFELAEPVPVVVGEENILETSGAAMITILEGTTFLDKNGNEIRENVNAILNFIDPSDNDFRNSPGRFRTVDGEELVSLGVINLQFESDVGDRLTPNGDIRISLDGLDDPEYTLWVLNSDGYWVEKISDPVVGGSQAFAGLASRKKRQTGNTYIGRFGIGDIGQWINIDKVSSASVCFIKTRIFDDLSFTSEVVDNGVDNYKPEILLKIGTGAPFQGLNLYRPPTFSPGQTCFEVRCGVTNSLGIVSVLTQETIGNGQSVLFPAVPIQLGHPQLPGSLNTELGILNYQMNTHKTEARLDFVSSPSGPLYENMTTCENSVLSDNSLWFARRAPMFTDTDFGIDVCYIRFEVEASTSTNEIFDQLLAFSAWGTGPYYYTYFTAHRSDFFMMTPKFYYACLRYRCSQPSDPTNISLDHFVTNQNLTCYTSGTLPAPILDAASPINGFYFGVDEIAVRGECLVETNPEKSAGSVLC